MSCARKAPPLRCAIASSAIVAGIPVRAQHECEDKGNDDSDRGAGRRDQKLLPRLIRHPRQACHAADRQQRDVPRADPEPTRGQRVPELVEHDAEQRQREQHALRGTERRSRRPIIGERQPGEENEECRMHPQLDAGDSTDRPRPFHRRHL
jgi:hypothetical protein